MEQKQNIEYYKKIFLDGREIKSKLINKKEPIIHRIYVEEGDKTYMLQKVFKSESNTYYMHSHSWDISLVLLKGSQEIGYGFSNKRLDNPRVLVKHIINEGDWYEITDENVYHYTKPLTDYTISLSVIGNRKREALSTNKGELTKEQIKELIEYLK